MMESREHYLKELADRRVLLAATLEGVRGKEPAWNMGIIWTEQINQIRGQLGKLSMDHEVRELRAEVQFYGKVEDCIG